MFGVGGELLHARVALATYAYRTMKVAFYDTKPYDHEFFDREAKLRNIEMRFFPFRLDENSIPTAADYDAICVFVNDTLNRECLELLAEQGGDGKSLPLIAMRCAGFNNLDVKTASELGFPVVRVPAYSPHAVAEHAVALVQTLNRRIHRAYNRVRELNFSLNGLVGHDLHGKTAAILGTGRIGRLTAKILRGYGMKLLAFDQYPNEEWAEANEITYTSLEEIYPRADLISLHLPLTKETDRLIDEEAIERMKPGVIIVNTSRGKLIRTSALIQGLKERKIGGVALDVYEEEEGIFFEDLSYDILTDDQLARLLTFPNVLVTSHQAFLTSEALGEIARVTCENLIRFTEEKDFLEGTEIRRS